MSSHHFVKEGQEPALYIHDVIPFEQVGALLEWAPIVITRSSQVEQVISWGIKVDVVLMETEDADVLTLLETQAPVRILPPAKLSVSLNEVLMADHQRNITVTATDLQQFLDLAPSLSTDVLTVVTPEIRWVSASHPTFGKWLPAGSVLLLYPQILACTVRGGELQGGRIVVESDGLVEITAEKSVFWVGEIL